MEQVVKGFAIFLLICTYFLFSRSPFNIQKNIVDVTNNVLPCNNFKEILQCKESFPYLIFDEKLNYTFVYDKSDSASQSFDYNRN